MGCAGRSCEIYTHRLRERRLYVSRQLHRNGFGGGFRRPKYQVGTLPENKPYTVINGDKTAAELAFTPDGKTLVSGCDDGALELWSVPDGKLRAKRKGHDHHLNALAISTDGKTLASCAGDIKLWTLPEGRLQATLQAPGTAIYALAISPDGKTLAAGDANGVITLWSLTELSLSTFLFAPKANPATTKAHTYHRRDQVTGRTITYTMPCGSPIPPDAICTCNCVPGAYSVAAPTVAAAPPSAPKPKPKPKRRTGGGHLSRPCDREPVPPGMFCSCNCVCTCQAVPSDRAVKEAFATTDPTAILQRLAELPVQSWNYQWDDASIRHIGPMAQDFAAAFGVGEDDKHICTVDAQGVAFAAIQGLYRLLQEKETHIANLQSQVAQQQAENQALAERLAILERLVAHVAQFRFPAA